MKLRELHVCNWCQHPDRTVTFGSGLTGILGPNGSGKSNLLQAITFAITGYTTSKKSDYLTYGADYGYVDLSFDLQDTSMHYRLRRNVHNGDLTLWRQLSTGELEKLASGSKARDMLQELTQITPDTAQQVFAVPQEDMVSLFRATPSVRNAVMQKIFSLQFFGRLRQSLKDLIAEADVHSAETRARISLLEDTILAHQKLISESPEPTPVSVLEPLIADTIKQMDEISEKIGSIKSRDYLLKERSLLLTTKNDLTRSLAAPEPVAPEDWSQREQFKRDHTKYTNYVSMLHRYIPQLTKVLEDAPVWDPAFDSELETLEASVLDLTTKFQLNVEKLRQLTSCEGKASCPTCGQSVSVSAQDVLLCKETNVRLEASLEESKNHIKQLQGQELKYQTFVARKANLVQDVRAYLHSIHETFDDTQTVESLLSLCTHLQEQYRVALSTLQQRLAIHEDYGNCLSNWLRQMDTNKLKLNETDASLVRVQSSLSQLGTVTESLESLIDFKESLSQQLASLHTQKVASLRYQEAKRELDDRKLQLATLKSSSVDSQTRFLEQLKAAEGLFHPGQLPNMVARHIYQLLTSKIDAYLSEFDAPYTVTLGDDGDFLCQFQDGFVESSSRLSGGEKMMLSVSFRLALHSVFATDDASGFIVLDEPTTFLDDKNKDGLARILGTIKTSPVFKDLQILVVTHDDALRHLFANVIDLSE